MWLKSRYTLPTVATIGFGFIGATTPALADIINVPGDQLTIQAAINVAVNGDEVIVAQGEYFENINFNGKAITVRSTDPNDAGVVLNTIINGGASGTVVTCTSGEGSSTVLSGFVITGGTGSLVRGLLSGGGMLNNNNSSPTVTNCSFSGNTASDGAGMFNVNSSNPTVTNCTFSGNSAAFGGGMGNFVDSSPTVTNCTFSGNTAAFGGGMGNDSSSPTVTNCSFGGNTASIVGGGMFNDNSSPMITNCGFCFNTPDQIDGPFTDGGGNSLEHCPPPPAPVVQCPADLDDNGFVGVGDLLIVFANWGPCP